MYLKQIWNLIRRAAVAWWTVTPRAWARRLRTTRRHYVGDWGNDGVR
jgi:hypothetical protein